MKYKNEFYNSLAGDVLAEMYFLLYSHQAVISYNYIIAYLFFFRNCLKYVFRYKSLDMTSSKIKSNKL